VFNLEDTTFDRRIDKITTCLVSLFSSAYIFYFQEEFGSLDMLNGVIPSFDARLVSYPNLKSLRDYFSWRQVDCHINNLFNYCFWLLVCGRVDFENRYGIGNEELAVVKAKDLKFREVNNEETSGIEVT
jgi:tRNA(His) 5'-end guanylyltransferase